MKTKIGVVVAAMLAGLSLSVASPNAKNAVTPQDQNAIVFVVFAGGSPTTAQVVPILSIENGEHKNPVAGDSDEAEIKAFSGKHYRRGQTYRMIFGGAEAGTLTITKFVGGECARTAAEGTVRGTQRLSRNILTLATDSKIFARGRDSVRRAPSASERTQAMELVRATFRGKGVAPALLTNVQTLNLTAMDFNHDGQAELVGSFVASKRTRPQARYALFLVAEMKNGRYEAALSQFDKYTDKDIMAGADLNAINDGVHVEKLIDQLDLDGQGWDELFTTDTGFEGDSYRVYRHQNGKWTSIYEFNNYRCAF